MELRHLRYFTAVADTLNFHRAAEILHLAQPALSSQIKSLEDELGVQLFHRTTRSVSLTHAGRVFLAEARTVLASATQAENRARNAQHGLVGHLRVGVLAPAANAWLARILRGFHQTYPGVQLSLFDLTSPDQITRLRSGELDVGLLRPPVGYADFESMLVDESGQVLAMPAGHRLAKLKTLRWQDFDGEGLVMMDPRVQHGYYDTFLAACAKAGAAPRPVQYAHDIQIKMWLISAGFGIAPVTDTLRQVKRPGLVFRALPSTLPRVPTVLVWRKKDDSPVLANFRAAFKELQR
ncbi:LysR family transcriptional regulator [Roseimicrobium gellanilyticum]|uniref:LysR family transcriptional regulator n=1 Tax=Roseimicrobium gellanilyticum TaxID=748857 RepID=A0A366HG53_9BACT|nr:LysR substrate-binding domain-containing protein [Roseimicrobium gellanilyticum]RBP40438.1 LysR family transcriptional regulator [Roseimicrobium gellanilyticum]